MERQFKDHPDNPRVITPGQLESLRKWLAEFGDLSGVTHNERTGHIVSGNQRDDIFDLSSAQIELTEEHEPDSQGTTAIGYIIWEGKRYSYRRVDWDEQTEKVASLIANHAGGTWDYAALHRKFDADMLIDAGFDPWEIGKTIDIEAFFDLGKIETDKEDPTIIKKMILTFTKEQYEKWASLIVAAGPGTTSEIFLNAIYHHESREAAEQP